MVATVRMQGRYRGNRPSGWNFSGLPSYHSPSAVLVLVDIAKTSREFIQGPVSHSAHMNNSGQDD